MLSYDLISPIDECIPLKDNCVSCIYSQSVLEHVRYPDRFFAEAFRVTAPGGRIYVHVPFTYPEHEAPYDFQRPTRYGVRRWLEDAGFLVDWILPALSNFYGASTFVIEAMRTDMRRCGHADKFPEFDQISALTDASPLRGPEEEITIPIGWIAIGSKSGYLTRHRYWSKEQFLQENKIP